ncbi:MAG: DUF3857 domain-containing protein [Bacteroidetes bacterium]|nr:DUF3857 domain-containing protein [Bacteroidota bacterium]
MKRILPLLFVAFSIAVSAQKAPAKFGDIPMEDMTMKVYPLDSSANAVVLFDYAVTYTKQASLNYEHHTRIKILKKEGLHLSNVAINLLKAAGTGDRYSKLNASTYNLEGNKIVETPLAKDGIFEEEFNKNINRVKFTLPNVREGSVIEYSYTVTSKHFIGQWRYQREIPIRHCEYWAMFPQAFIFEKYAQGYVPLATYTAEIKRYYGQLVTANHYVAKDVPAFRDEPYMTTEEDYIAKINFALSYFYMYGITSEIMGSWDKLTELLRNSKNFGKAITGSGFLKDDVEKITDGITDPLKKIEALSAYVKNNFEWDGTSEVVTDPLKNVFEKKKGSSGDLNILLASMLNKAGFDVEMVLLSTRDHGFVRPSIPMSKQFNYCISSVKVGDKTLLLDATEKYLPFDALPARCFNGQGLKISENTYSWIDIATKAKDRTYITAEFSLLNGSTLDGKVTYISDGYDALRVRKDYFSKGEEDYLKSFTANKQWNLVNKEFKDMNAIDKSAKVSYEIIIDEHAMSSGNIIYLNPFVEQRIQENPFKSKERTYPVDYGNKIEKVYSFKMPVPEGFVIDELPKSKVFTMPNNVAKFVYNASTINDVITIACTFQINKTLFVQDEYPALREFYNLVVAKQAEQIVLKKK